MNEVLMMIIVCYTLVCVSLPGGELTPWSGGPDGPATDHTLHLCCESQLFLHSLFYSQLTSFVLSLVRLKLSKITTWKEL